MIKEYDNVLDNKPLRAVCVTVADDHQKLKVLADVLLQSTETAPLGRDLADKYCESIIIFILAGTIAVCNVELRSPMPLPKWLPSASICLCNSLRKLFATFLKARESFTSIINCSRPERRAEGLDKMVLQCLHECMHAQFLFRLILLLLSAKTPPRPFML